jgi:hypothetical protein
MKLFSTRISLTIDSLELGEVSHRSLIAYDTLGFGQADRRLAPICTLKSRRLSDSFRSSSWRQVGKVGFEVPGNDDTVLGLDFCADVLNRRRHGRSVAVRTGVASHTTRWVLVRLIDALHRFARSSRGGFPTASRLL